MPFSDDQVNTLTEELQAAGRFAPNDFHILAQAQFRGARLSDSNDRDIQ